MLSTLIKKMFGSRNERTLRRMEKSVMAINAFEPKMQALSNEELAGKTQQFKERFNNGESLDELLAEAFATVREVSLRTLGLRHFDVQLIGGMVLHEGNIAEMRTGEGKTLVATLPAYLNAISGRGVHIVTVNDYLAKRDSQWMKPIYEFLGLTVGVIYPDMSHKEKQEAYKADIVYGTNNEYGFDYLRDNMAFSLTDKVQRELNFAIVDEVDSILIDEARTPLIISGAAEDSSELYIKINSLIPQLKKQEEEGAEGDYTVDEKQKQAHLTDAGHLHIEELLVKAKLLDPGESLYHASNIMLMHHVNAALKAHAMFHKDIDYIVKDNQVVIVDEHTGRTMPGRRWSEGLHQAVEAKEGVPIQNENQTLASITFQNFFRMYNKLSGMTGTADTEAYEFQQIYNLEVVVIPTNKPMVRKDEADLVYLTQADKFQAIIEDIRACSARRQPVLVGTVSIEASEFLSQLLKKANIKHQVLNAKFHEKEAQIIAEAGRPGAVTIATNMAGRGTDIVLGGSLAADLANLLADASEQEKEAVKKEWQKRHDEVIAAGGLRIIGSERHESRRIDNQLRGRAGRQGDPGSSRFYLSLEDNLMRIFASDRVASMMRRLGMQPGEPIEHSLVTRAIENAQRKLEGHHFDVRKQLLDYDNVANDQRQVIYTQRSSIMEMTDTQEIVEMMREEVMNSLVDTYIPPQSLEDQWDPQALSDVLSDEFKIKAPVTDWINEDHSIQPEQIKDKILALAIAHYDEKVRKVGRPVISQFEKSIILQTLDNHWREHLAAMDQLRQGIHLRGYAQKDPKQEYKKEAFSLFTMMLDNLKYEVIRILSSVEIQTEEDAHVVEEQRRADQIKKMNLMHENLSENEEASETQTFRRQEKKVGRNDPCPCGSGKKYKACHGSLV
ncbi:preprotein translocase subunit SecA [Legionella pneumophila]|uniref:Protein translocase subunit SecA n=1 Tax=Legionella pneumophila subsp. pascullei TaxID=91890 RepID=A0AAX2IXD7_LEGPN|nr:preprotein translocase subunit SecA [Legionella pneumophila]AMP89889.1 preprotein translocase subunit SecA [Legionella pneumophila subsp. pascullei]AMP92445.1 preprotein translocase subunit SecA [Legionella pneumophila subsp. pascullei]AMP95411.1 preprotein translocase subunit SecA [Legionella pneumophila subsp. pascullei]SQG90309.1 preprotein translocase, secretion protein SecA [Legionella pneumophila subsp. pascullei]VEH06452.1 preprotein translocase, secretion protein SecA [Legionella pn